MDFTSPQPLTDVLAQLDAKTPVGSVMRSAEWETMPQQIRDSAFFSAGVTDAAFLAQQQASIRDMIARARATNEAGESYWKMDRGQFVKQLRLMGEAVGVQHPNGPRENGIKEKDITDPISIARLRLVVNTQLEMAYGQGQYLAAMDPDILSGWPAWELVRITPKKAPRDWIKRWLDAGGTLHDGRMIALKTDPIWSAISRFGKPHPPFDYNSGMGVEEIDRDTADHLGLLTKPAATNAGKQAKGKANQDALNKPLNRLEDDLQASVSGIDDGMRKRLQSVFGDQVSIDGDAAKWHSDAPAEDDTVKVREANPQPPREPEKIPAKPVTFKQPPAFEPSKGGGSVEVDAQLAKTMETAVLNDKALTLGRPALDVPPAARTIISSFEQGIRGKLLEHAKLYNAQGKEIDSQVGTTTQVSFPSALCQDAIMTHRHPKNTPPGLDDLEALLCTNMKELRAVADDGVFSLRPGDAGTGKQAFIEAVRAWHTLDPQLDAVMSRLAKAHQWSVDEYGRRYLQAMYSVLAQRGLISYSYEPFP